MVGASYKEIIIVDLAFLLTSNLHVEYKQRANFCVIVKKYTKTVFGEKLFYLVLILFVIAISNLVVSNSHE